MKIHRVAIPFVALAISGLLTSTPAQSAVPDVPGVVAAPVATSISLGAEHSCVVRDGTVWCAGNNTYGQLGTGTKSRSIYFAPSLLSNAVSVAAGAHQTCAITRDALLWCWGLQRVVVDPVNAPNTQSKTSVIVPTQVPLTNVQSVAVGPDHSCALRTDRTVWCWGANKYGQLGNGTTIGSVVPVQAAITNVVSVDVGAFHTCAVRTTQSVWCWGRNNFHQLGQPLKNARVNPTYVPRVRATFVSTGQLFTCIVSTAKRSQCWGRNNYGQLATSWGASRSRPVTGSRSGLVSLSAGAEFVCGTTVANTTWCWGRNRYGQLANGSYIAKASAQKVLPADRVGPLSAVVAGDSHACGVAVLNASLWCWGLNNSGQLGDSSTTLRRSGTAIWPTGVQMKPIGSQTSARLVVAGDIACNARRRAVYGMGPLGTQCGEASTAALVQSMNPEAVIALGDLVHEESSIQQFRDFYDTTWGAFKNITYPLRGNHEYLTSGAAGFVEYFGEMSAPYWSTDAGGWRLIAVDSWCQGQVSAGCADAASQTQWLKQELQRARTEGKCAAVFMHHPFVSSGQYATPSVQHLWKAAVTHGADLIMSGHDHHYERFSSLDENGIPAQNGVPFIISGLGGGHTYTMRTPVPGSQFITNAAHGVVELLLTPTTFSWGFVSALDNQTYDAGSASCTP